MRRPFLRMAVLTDPAAAAADPHLARASPPHDPQTRAAYRTWRRWKRPRSATAPGPHVRGSSRPRSRHHDQYAGPIVNAGDLLQVAPRGWHAGARARAVGAESIILRQVLPAEPRHPAHARSHSNPYRHRRA